MPFSNFTNLDFDQIKTSIKDYLRTNSNFTDFDFDGSNFSVLIDTLAYNTYITAFNSNMIVNESFLDSATLRENVVSLAGNVGYTPRSRTAANAQISFDVSITNDVSSITLQPGLVCTGDVNNETYTFAITEPVSTNVVNNVAKFENINVYQGTYLEKKFTYNGSLDQKFILDNSFIDTSKIVVFIKNNGDSGDGTQYTLANDIIEVNSESKIFLIKEVQDEKYELKFGDGFFGKKLGTGPNKDGDVITVRYITTDGEDGNGIQRFSFSGLLKSGSTFINVVETPTISTISKAQNGGNIESIDSVKYYSPLMYSSQNRAVTARDYEAIIKRVYPNTESVSVIGGEELDPPEFGTVAISIKPKNGDLVSDFSKNQILSKLKQYSISGINQKIIDLKLLYIEIDSNIYYNDSLVTTADTLKTNIINSLNTYSKSINLNKFGGRLKYSKLLKIIDDTDQAITSNITKIRIRRNLQVTTGRFAQYELCFGNRFYVDPNGYNIKSTGFSIFGQSGTLYLSDVPNSDLRTGILRIIKILDDDTIRVVVSSAGSIDYEKGEVNLSTINFESTVKENNIVEVQVFPRSNDVVGLKDLYVSLDVSNSTINMVRDVISSGDEVSGVQFTRDFYSSSYPNGQIIRT
ncbi:MAG: baseplate wedge protein [Euryarchaeota archaeon]|nr:baseplate wedge protein [Euryarchaeota archaeon]|tara:strand:- start:19204 stop:21108 length:1905 start_codon:yes stop_codon:yes gene_type:complete